VKVAFGLANETHAVRYGVKNLGRILGCVFIQKFLLLQINVFKFLLILWKKRQVP